MLHYSIIVSGKVQGVWYRKSTLEKANELTIYGFVKNLANGSVYIEAEGSEEQLAQLLAWCAIGPEFANVLQVTHTIGSLKHFEGFKIIS
ncbi:acylphosphatase [Aquimarina sp. W85]|uniref:acylphosphatase n=1 Tax=Aquimarina rhodophyticola TaxID=3342246 RepID=UPI00366B82D2